MTKSSNIDAIEQKTSTSWEGWLDYLKSIDAENLPHKDIADHVRSKLASSLENAGWWAQSITVAYEQHIGRRNPGQRSDGSYEATASKTINGSMDDAMNAWLNLISGKKDFNGHSKKLLATTGGDEALAVICGIMQIRDAIEQQFASTQR